MFLFLFVIQTLVAAALVAVILMQRSEGGGLGIGGSPSGMMSARGAANFLSRATKWLAVAFVVLSIVLAAVAVDTTGGDGIESTLDRTVTPAADPLAPEGPLDSEGLDGDPPVDSVPEASDDPLAGATE